MADDRLYNAMIKKALRLAVKGEGSTSPNPMVGAVVFDHDGVIADGFHHKAGGPHAEIIALRRAGEKARGASLAINLEPCCHVGRTGPCTEAILQAGIKKVIFSIEDPYACVYGRGARFLATNGIEVISGVRREEAARLNEVYLKDRKSVV
jgi:diaminohydroxyphosphoribosylaminopyrimidine deaminase/5-amino-6-(5-phosphoribosylamino)uracil reductase